jgi:hypothetical protein
MKPTGHNSDLSNVQLGMSMVRTQGMLRHLQPNLRLLEEVDEVTSAALSRIHHVIITQRKELAGITTVFALDYDVLHAYLFPSIQSTSSTVAPALARFVLENSSAPLILPPGTCAELLSFASRAFPCISRFNEMALNEDPFTLSPAELAELKNISKKFSPDQNGVIEVDRELNEPVDEFVFKLSENLAAIIHGFRRLSALIRSGKIIPIEKVYPEKGELQPDMVLPLANAYAARLAAQQAPNSRRSSFSNIEDGKNLAAVSLIDSANAKLFLGGKSCAQSKIYSIQLLTETASILNLAKDPGDDVIANRLNIPKLHRDGVRHGSYVCPLSTAVIYCLFERHYATPQERHAQAIQQLVEMTNVGASFFKAEAVKAYGLVHVEKASDQLKKKQKKSREEWNRCVEDLWVGFERYAAKWFHPLRELQALGASEIESRLHLGEGAASTEMSRQPWDFIDPSFHQLSFFGSFEPTNDNGPDAIAQAFGIRSKSRVFEHQPDAQQIVVECLYNNQGLMKCERFGDATSAKIPIRLGLDKTLIILNEIIGNDTLGDWQLHAEYDEPAFDFRPTKLDADAYNRRHERMISTSEDHRRDLRVGDLFLRGRQHSLNSWHLLPAKVFLNTDVGSLCIGMPFASTNDQQVVTYQGSSLIGFINLLRPWLHKGHPWRMIDGICAYLEGVFNSFQQSKDEEGHTVK